MKYLLYALKILWIFFYVFMYLFMWRKGGGVTNACICMGTHSLSYRTDWWILTKLGRDEVIMSLHMRFGFLARSAQRWIQGGTKIGQWGVLSLEDFFFRSECNYQQTECILVSWIKISRLFAVRTDFTSICHVFYLYSQICMFFYVFFYVFHVFYLYSKFAF